MKNSKVSTLTAILLIAAALFAPIALAGQTVKAAAVYGWVPVVNDTYITGGNWTNANIWVPLNATYTNWRGELIVNATAGSTRDEFDAEFFTNDYHGPNNGIVQLTWNNETGGLLQEIIGAGNVTAFTSMGSSGDQFGNVPYNMTATILNGNIQVFDFSGNDTAAWIDNNNVETGIGSVVAYQLGQLDYGSLFGSATVIIDSYQGITPTPTPTPRPSGSVAPTPNSIETISGAPQASLFEFVLLCIALIVIGVVAYLIFPLLGIAGAIVGVIGSAFFWNAQTIIISQYTVKATLTTYYSLMPIGYFILLPIALAGFNAAVPIMQRK